MTRHAHMVMEGNDNEIEGEGLHEVHEDGPDLLADPNADVELDHLASQILEERKMPKTQKRLEEAQTYAKQERQREIARSQVKAALRQKYREIGWEEAELHPLSKANPTGKKLTYFFNPAEPTQVVVPSIEKHEEYWAKSEPDRASMKRQLGMMHNYDIVDLHGMTIRKNAVGSYNVEYPTRKGYSRRNVDVREAARLIDNYMGVEVYEKQSRSRLFKERKDTPVAADKLKQLRREGLSANDIPDTLVFHSPEDVYDDSNHENVKGVREGWKAQHQFNKQQRERAKNQYASGEYYKGWQLWSPSGELKARKVPEEKADIGIGANKEYKVTTSRFELLHPQDAKTGRSKITFAMKHHPGSAERDENKESLSIQDSVTQMFHDLGVNSFHMESDRVSDEEGKTVGWNYRVVTPPGTLINPGQAARMQDAVDERFGLAESEEGPAWHLEGPRWEQIKVRVPNAASRMPKGIRDEEVVDTEPIKNMYSKGLTVQLGHRDPETGQLAEGQKDKIAVKLPKLPKQRESQVAYWNLQERSDSIGFGKNWRPGEKDINEFLTVPARHRENQRVEEAMKDYIGNDFYYDAEGNPTFKEHDPSKLDKIIREKYPDASDDKVKKVREEMMALAAAAPAAGYYTARKGAVKKVINKVPGVKKFQVFGPDTGAAYREYFGQKYARAVDRAKHPLTDPLDPDAHGWDMMLKPERYRSVRYRGRFIQEDKYKARQIERERRQLQDVAKARIRVRDAIVADPNEMSRLARVDRKMTLRTAPGVLKKSDELDYENKVPRLAKEHLEAWSENPKAEDIVSKEHKTSYQALRELQYGADTDIDRNALKQALKPTREFVPGEARLPKLGKAGMYIAGGALVVGAGVYGYDKYRQHEISEGHTQGPSKHLPETVTYYTPNARVTNKYTIPKGNVSSALDVEGKKVPYAWRFEIQKKTKRIRNHTDVSGEGYKAGPLVGGLGLEKSEGSFGKSLMYQPSANLRTPDTGTVSIAGKELPINVKSGKKERWSQTGAKSYRLSRGNPNKLSQPEREQIAFLAVSSPNDHDREMIHQLYGDDEEINRLREDPEEMKRIKRKYNHLYTPKGEQLSTNKYYLTPQHQQRLIEAQERREESNRRLEGSFAEYAGSRKDRPFAPTAASVHEEQKAATRDYRRKKMFEERT